MLSNLATEIFAIFVLASMLGALLAWMCWSVRAQPFSFARWLFHALNMVEAKILWRTEVSGPLPLAAGQGAVIVCNHRGSLDPALVQMATDRMVHWLVAREYCDARFLGTILSILQVIPVGRRGIDTKATRSAIRRAQEGGIVGMFPEGRINRTDQFMLPGRPGAAMVALKARVPVVPCYVEGIPYDGTALGCLLMPAQVRVVVGEAIDLSEHYGRENDRERLNMLTKEWMRKIAQMAGVHDFEPELAGRHWKPDPSEAPRE